MACIGADGKPSVSGIKLLRTLQSGFKAPEEIAKDTALPLFRVRSGLREMLKAGLVSQNGDTYAITGEGKSLV